MESSSRSHRTSSWHFKHIYLCSNSWAGGREASGHQPPQSTVSNMFEGGRKVLFFGQGRIKFLWWQRSWGWIVFEQITRSQGRIKIKWLQGADIVLLKRSVFPTGSSGCLLILPGPRQEICSWEKVNSMPPYIWAFNSLPVQVKVTGLGKDCCVKTLSYKTAVTESPCWQLESWLWFWLAGICSGLALSSLPQESNPSWSQVLSELVSVI